MEIKSFKLVKNAVMFLTLAIAFITILAMYFGVYKQAQSNESILNRELLDENQRLVALNRIQDVQKQSDAAMAYLEDSADVQNFIKNINEIARVSNIKIKSIEPLKSEGIGNYIKLAVTVEVENSYHSVAKFVENIENYSKFIKVEKIDMHLDESDLQMTRTLLKEGNIVSAGISMPMPEQRQINLSAPAKKAILQICTYTPKR